MKTSDSSAWTAPSTYPASVPQAASTTLSRAVRFSIGVLALLVVLAAFGFFFRPHAGTCCATPPSTDHWLGTAASGADLAITTLRALGTSAAVCVVATLLASIFGVLWGAAAAALPRRIDDAMMRIVDSLGAAPYTLFVVTLVVIVRAARPSLPEVLAARALDARVILVLCVASIEWLTLARVVHARMYALRRRGFMEAARVIGVSRVRIFLRHVVPHTIRPLLAYAVLALPSALAAEGFFSFLGFGVEAPSVSLGTMVADGARAMSVAPLTFLLPAGVLVAATVALHVVGATLRDALRPDGAS